MAHLTLYQDHYTNATIVSNCFIDRYMADANDAQLKVYLYLIRMLNARQTISICDIADKFNHTEKEVLRALRYWEDKELLTLDYDDAQNLTGIHLRDLVATNDATQTPCAQPDTTFEKPSYSVADLKAFQERNETAQLLFIAETYKGAPLAPTEMMSMLFFKDKLHFSDDLIDHLLQYCFERGKKNFKYIERVAMGWAQAGITNVRQAQQQTPRYEKNTYTIMNALGKSGSPTPKELEYINRWSKEYAFTVDIILEACERTVLATDNHRFEYADGILRNWKQDKVHHKSDIRKMDEKFLRKQQTAKKFTPATANRFNQFAQNQYDYAALEKEILSN